MNEDQITTTAHYKSESLTITTRRLSLREFGPEDFHAVHQYASDPIVVKYLSWGPNSENETIGFLDRAAKSRLVSPRIEYHLAIVLPEGTLIGGCSIEVADRQNEQGTIGYMFNRQYWHQGYATEVAKLLVGFGFGHLRLHRIWATCDPANTYSEKVLVRIGMKKEGILRENLKLKDRWRNSLLYAILSDEHRIMESK